MARAVKECYSEKQKGRTLWVTKIVLHRYFVVVPCSQRVWKLILWTISPFILAQGKSFFFTKEIPRILRSSRNFLPSLGKCLCYPRCWTFRCIPSFQKPAKLNWQPKSFHYLSNRSLLFFTLAMAFFMCTDTSFHVCNIESSHEQLPNSTSICGVLQKQKCTTVQILMYLIY